MAFLARMYELTVARTKKDLAAALGVVASKVGAWEAVQFRPSLRVLTVIERRLEGRISLSELRSLLEEPDTPIAYRGPVARLPVEREPLRSPPDAAALRVAARRLGDKLVTSLLAYIDSERVRSEENKSELQSI